jgi:hypothetical protein
LAEVELPEPPARIPRPVLAAATRRARAKITARDRRGLVGGGGGDGEGGGAKASGSVKTTAESVVSMVTPVVPSHADRTT